MGLDIPGVMVEPVKFGGLFMLCLALKCLGSEFVSVCVGERVVAGSPSCVDVLRLSALVATDGEM